MAHMLTPWQGGNSVLRLIDRYTSSQYILKVWVWQAYTPMPLQLGTCRGQKIFHCFCPFIIPFGRSVILAPVAFRRRESDARESGSDGHSASFIRPATVECICRT